MQLLKTSIFPTTTMATITPDERLALFQHAGLADHAIDATLRIDALLQNWRRRLNRRELGIQALRDLRVPLNLAQLDVLVAIEAPEHEFGQTTGEDTMVGTVAERLGIDPSRASRVVAEMVEAGYAVRDVCQSDARRTIIRLTEQGAAVVAAVRAHKFLLLGDFLAEWSPADLDTFVTLLERFSGWSDNLAERRTKFEHEIGILAAAAGGETPVVSPSKDTV